MKNKFFSIIICLCLLVGCNNSSKPSESSLNLEDLNAVVITVGYYPVRLGLYNFLLNTTRDFVFQTLEQSYLMEEQADETQTMGQLIKSYADNYTKNLFSLYTMAIERGIVLTSADMQQLEDEKAELIETLGGNENFYQWLLSYGTTETDYDYAAQLSLYSEKMTDQLEREYTLSAADKAVIAEAFNDNYISVRHYFYATADMDTLASLSAEEREQKKADAEKMLALIIANDVPAADGQPDYFTANIINNSEDTDTFLTFNKDGSEQNGQVVDKAFLAAAKELSIGEVTQNIVQSDYGFHIIKRYPLDNTMLESLYAIQVRQLYMAEVNATEAELGYNTIPEFDKILPKN